MQFVSACSGLLPAKLTRRLLARRTRRFDALCCLPLFRIILPRRLPRKHERELTDAPERKLCGSTTCGIRRPSSGRRLIDRGPIRCELRRHKSRPHGLQQPRKVCPVVPDQADRTTRGLEGGMAVNRVQPRSARCAGTRWAQRIFARRSAASMLSAFARASSTSTVAAFSSRSIMPT